MRLLTNNPDKRAGLEGYGLSIEERIPLQTVPDASRTAAYLRTKQEKLGHLLDVGPEAGAVNVRSGRRPTGAGLRVAVVAARFNEVVTAALVEGALAGLAQAGVADDDVTVAWVPGAFEIPLVARARSRRAATSTP